MKFTIEQIAICPQDPVRAKNLLAEMGAVTWHDDHVVASGSVFGQHYGNEADLAFNYELDPEHSKLEVEVLHYTKGTNWMQGPGRFNSVSHLGMHCTEAQLDAWRGFFAQRGISVAQEVTTSSHTNPVIAGLRRYTYVVFDTKHILGVDLKFIVRLNQEGGAYP